MKLHAVGRTLMLLTWLCTLALAASPPVSASDWRAQQHQAAEKSEQILRRVEKVRGLLAQYQMMHAAYLADDSKAFRMIFGQYLSWHQTYLGMYEEARKSFSIAQVPNKADAPSPLDDAKYSSTDGAEAVLRLTKDRQAVFFNEAHNEPVTRSLTVQLLARLREQGYTHFASETLDETDTALQQRGYPVTSSGFYTQEPVYGEMVRTALKLGYTVVSYEAMSEATGDAREREQARNLYERVFKQNPNARLVVNAGYAHIVESGKYLGGASMATHFKRISSIDPVTVEQTMLIEHRHEAENHPIYSAVVAKLKPNSPIAFLDAAGKGWSLQPEGYDLSVFFPPDVEDEGRPTWLTLGGLRGAYPVAGELCREHLPCLIEARYAGESDDAIPADRIVFGIKDPNSRLLNRAFMSTKEMHAELYLRPGRYRLRALSADNEPFSTSNIVAGNGTRGDDKP